MRFQKHLPVFILAFILMMGTLPSVAFAGSLDSYEIPAKVCKCGFPVEPDPERFVAPTCTMKGTVPYQRCASCGARQMIYTIPALGHTPGRTNYIDPGCEWFGIIQTFCARCDALIDAVEDGAPVGHNWEPDPDFVGHEPTCTEPGSVDMYCTVCRRTKVDEIPALGGEHVLVESLHYPPTCLLYGFNRFDCQRCGFSDREQIPSLGHDWIETSRKSATCTGPGSIGYSCSRCSETKSEAIPQLAEDHTWQEASRTPATCITAGSVSYNCSVCHEEKADPLPALGHAWEETSRQPATCTETGYIKRTCTQCDFSASEELPALGVAHSWKETERVDATQTSAGLVAYTCSVCGASRSERIPPLGLDLTMSGLLENMTGILTACLGWTGVVADGIAENPIFLLIVVTGFIGSGVVLFRRILKL